MNKHVSAFFTLEIFVDPAVGLLLAYQLKSVVTVVQNLTACIGSLPLA